MTIKRVVTFNADGSVAAELDERVEGVRYHQLGDERTALALTQNFVAFTPEENAARDAEELAFAADAPRRAILDQIRAIESTITQRRLREAALGIDAGWLTERDDEIAALRSQL